MKNQYIAALLAIFLGGFGVHRFYLGNIFIGILYLLFCWTGIPAILGIIEGVYFLCIKEPIFNLKYNQT